MMAVFAINRLVQTVIIFYEITFLVLLIAVVVFLARPLVEAYSDRIRSHTKAIERTPMTALEEKVAQLESEIMELKVQLKSVQESTDFVIKLSQSESKVSSIDEHH